MVVTTDRHAAARDSALFEVRHIDYVPENARHGSVRHQALFWFMGNFGFFSIAIGFIGPSLGLGLGWTVVAACTGAALGGFTMAFHASQGPTLGLPQMVQSRAQFGHRGVLAPLAVCLFNFVVFNVLFITVIASGLDGIWGWDPTAVGLTIAMVAGVLAVFGHDWLHRALRALFWSSVPLFVLLTVGVVTGAAGGTPPAAAGFSASGFMAVVAVCASYNVTFAPYVSDYTRYLPTSTPAVPLIMAVFAGACLSLVWLVALGAWMASRLGATDALVGLNDSGNAVVPGLGSALAVLSVLALVATMGMNTYSAMLAVVTMADSLTAVRVRQAQRVGIVIAITVVGAAVGTSLSPDYLTAVYNLLNILLYLLIPWSAVNLADYFLVRRGRYAITDLFSPAGIYGVWGVRGLAAFAVGLVVEVPFMVLSFYTGPVATAIDRVDLSMFAGLGAAGLTYLLLSRGFDASSEDTAISRSEEALASGALSTLTDQAAPFGH